MLRDGKARFSVSRSFRGDDNGTEVAVKSDELRAEDRIVIGENRIVCR